MKYEIRSIGIWALIKVGFFLNLLIGFLFGIFASLIFIPMARVILAMVGAGEMPSDQGSSFGMLFFMPFLLAILGAFFNTLFMALVAACYNLVARVVGGLEFSFNTVPDDKLMQVVPVAEATALANAPGPRENVPGVILPPAPPPFRPAPVVPAEDDLPASTPEAMSLPAELPVKIRQSEEMDADSSPVVEPHTEPDEDGPRQDNP